MNQGFALVIDHPEKKTEAYLGFDFWLLFDVGNKLRTAVREFDSKSERTRLATGSFLTAVVDLPSQQSQANEQISSADGSFGVATATGPTGPTFAGSGNQHTKADAPGDRRQRFNK